MSDLTELHIQNLGCIRGGRPVCKGLNFKIQSGEILALRGSNGCGKTTVLRVLSGLLEPIRGKVFCNQVERPIFPYLTPKEFTWLAYGNGIKLSLSAIENLQFLSILMPNGDISKIEKAIDIFGLSDVAHKEARFYSAGQMRRLALCRLIISPAPLWLMDEPLNALDRDGRNLLAQLIQEHIKTGGFVIMADHEDFLKDQANNLDMSQFAISAKKGWET